MKNAETGLTDEQWARLEALENMPDDQIDYSDIPPTTDWSTARRGLFQMPKGTALNRNSQPTPADTSEKGLETRIFNLLQESGWLSGDYRDYDPAACVDLGHLAAFLQDTQPEAAQALSLDSDDNTRRQFLSRLKREIGNKGIIDVLRNGIEHRQHSVPALLRHPVAGQPGGRGAPRQKPLLRNPAGPLQHQEPQPLPGPGPLHQRAAGPHL